ncbi:PspC domain-containing protein [Nocardioides acrostichi]|uniref:PspC domain-containing protein n=1 Tax=Nocardioides acrostichi TaxID=2784339 RepID=A0A930V0Q6_9ACTN|nr:PspC domain-containing protein [Nocardioides acrostichi]MBF4161731.1 PspC domain-containing protein [Nocardioides acrostichi]
MTEAPQPCAYQQPKRLTRDPHDKMLGGVCSGAAQYLGLDPSLVRILTVVATVLGAGSLVIAYLAAWVLVPLAEASSPTG